MPKTRDGAGRFQRTRQPWTPSNWDDGYSDKKGRFRVYRPDYPRCWANGYAFRAHIVWWLETDKPAPKHVELHHRDHTRLNDEFSNLVPLTNSEHQSTHKANWVPRICERCGKTFREHAWRVRQNPVRFCSVECRDNGQRPERKKRVVLSCRHCGKQFEVVQWARDIRLFCSQACSAKWQWRHARRQ